MKEKTKARTLIYFAAIVILGIIFLAFPIKDILIGTYLWGLSQKTVTQGIVEIGIVCLTGVTLILTVNNNSLRTVFLILISSLYMQNHQFLIPYLAAIIYLEMISNIGTSIRKICKLRVENQYLDYLSSFVVGIAVWGTAAIVFSLLGKGNFTWLRILTVCLFAISLLIYRRKPLFVYAAENFKTKDKKEQILVFFLFTLILIQGAKSWNTFDYDSLWYGLKAEYVLIGENSFYDNLGMLTWVHYFPKFFELFIAPLSDLGEYSFIHAVNVQLYGFLILTIYKFLSVLKFSDKKALFYTILIATIPAIANMSTTAKPDIFTSFLAVFSAIYFFYAAKKKDFYYLSLAYAALILSACGKISSYPYIAILFLSGSLTFVFVQKENCIETILKKENISCLLILGFSMITFLGTHYRTYVLTGYPLYPFTVNLWKKIGFTGVYPFADFFGGRKAGFADGTVFNFQFYIKHMFNLVFTPSKVSEYRINNLGANWYGNFGVFLSVIVVFDIIRRKVKHHRKNFSEDFKIATGILLPLWVGMILISVFLFQYAQDGNYYIVPVSLGITYFAYVFEQRNFENIKMYYGIFLAFLVLQFVTMFVTHISWHHGTSAIGFNLLKSSFDSYDNNMKTLESNGVRDFEEYIVWQSYTDSRALGDGNEQVLFRLSTGFEYVRNAMGMTKGIFESEEDLLKYLDWANINFLIIPRENLNSSDNSVKYQNYINVFSYFQELEDVFQLETEDYILLDITSYTDSLNKRKEGYSKANIENT